MLEVVIVLLLLCLIMQSIYIYRVKQQAIEWLSILRTIKEGQKQKAFTKTTGIIADINYELNSIIAAYLTKIVELKAAETANKEVLTSLSHDLRTPLASLLGYLEALHNGLVSAKEQEEYIKVAYRKAYNLKSFTDLLFEWFKLNSNEQTFNFIETDVNELTREIIIEWLPVFKNHGIRVSVQIAESELGVMLDKAAYARIINNLLQNAIDHSGADKVTVSITSEKEFVNIEVANNGAAIPKDKLPFIFDRLYKGDAARSGSGSGLGLAITKELVLLHHGEILAGSKPGGNTYFRIILRTK